MQSLKQDIDIKMKKCIFSFKESVKKISTGRARPSLLDSICIEYYGNIVPLRKLSNIVVEDSHTLRINTFDESVLTLVKKSIMKSNLGLNPIVFGKSIKVFIPLLTEERRKELIKSLSVLAELARISIRNIRREANEIVKKQKAKKIMNNDEEHINQVYIQKMTDGYIKKIDAVFIEKKYEIMKV